MHLGLTSYFYDYIRPPKSPNSRVLKIFWNWSLIFWTEKIPFLFSLSKFTIWVIQSSCSFKTGIMRGLITIFNQTMLRQFCFKWLQPRPQSIIFRFHKPIDKYHYNGGNQDPGKHVRCGESCNNSYSTNKCCWYNRENNKVLNYIFNASFRKCANIASNNSTRRILIINETNSTH